jgi:hypothetical protein
LRILTSSGLYLSGSPETILLRLAELVECGVAIHAADENRYFLSEGERSARYLERDVAEIVAMSPVEILQDMEEGGHLLIAEGN